ncbi:hypothetical protein PF010_g21467 [Phytophthora fragariae]|uniref:Uncharacterized protein n=1 Tax=Phytophthora fragariae TaxID=53985 RepID=A0A6G0PDI2_9STRA|nr:hypothetical protein PF010_g21467 [Phytophthora fragariae]KAE9243384.1 hypothetical protein PF004_g6152 [Phytophthora fragariae]KAE9346598.1 hypothetical protein PF008_g8208 [Phytophthora fragariae]
MSTNRRAVCLAVTSAGTAARCTILLKRSMKTTIPVLRWLSGGRPKTKSIEMDCQPYDGDGSDRSGACEKVAGFTR